MEYALFNPGNMNMTSSDQSENFFARQLFEWSSVQKCTCVDDWLYPKCHMCHHNYITTHENKHLE